MRLVARLFCWSGCLMLVGWFLSCGTRWYDNPAVDETSEPPSRLARHPVVPSAKQIEQWRANVTRANWTRTLAEPPFVPPPKSSDPIVDDDNGSQGLAEGSHQYRRWNYWMMSQRAGTTPYLTFGAGCALACYGLFYFLSDVLGFRIGIFRTFGTNALTAFVLHTFVENAFTKFVPRDAPAEIAWVSFELFFLVCWFFVRGLEKRNIYVTL